MRGGDGVPWPAAGADFFGIFLLRDFSLVFSVCGSYEHIRGPWVFMGIRRTCGQAITPCDSLSALLTVPSAQLTTCIARGLSIQHSVTT